MATSTITNVVKDPGGTEVVGCRVIVTLMPTAGFRTDTFSEVARTVETVTDVNGAYSINLERNSNITPANTFYSVVELIPDARGGKRVWNISVGSSNQSVLASLVDPLPDATGGTYLTQSAADARYQALGSLGSGTPGTETPDHAGTAGVSTSASRDDHVHPIVAAAASSIGTANSEGVATSFARSDHVHTGAALGTLANGYASSTATQAAIGAEVDVTGCSVTVTLVTGRRYRITGRVNTGTASAADTNVFILIKDGSTEVGRIAGMHSNTAKELTLFGSTVVTGNGSKTYKLTIQSVGGTAATTNLGNSPNFILIEDIGV